MALLFRYSLLNKRLDDPASQQPVAGDRQLSDSIRGSIERHDNKVVSKIQKRRGRKKFILKHDDYESGDSIFAACLSKREQKYLSKVVEMQ